MTTLLTPTPVQKFFDNNGNPLNQGQLFSYQAGTAIPLSTYTDSTGSTPNPNPTILNARGEAGVWIPSNVAYKLTLQDSLGNQIWSVDQIVNSQLLTLYGGVDTGSANAYVLSFVANFTAYVDGIIIYWIPSHTNTGASTVNVNGLGVVNVVSQSGGALSGGSIVANQILGMFFKGGIFMLLNNPNVLVSDGTAQNPSIAFASEPNFGFFNVFTGGIGIAIAGQSIGSLYGTTLSSPVWTGFASLPAGSIRFNLCENIVTMSCLAGITGTSNATSMSITNVSSLFMPSSALQAANCWLIDNGTLTQGTVSTTGLSTIVFSKGVAPPSATGFTATGTKGIPAGFMASWPTS